MENIFLNENDLSAQTICELNLLVVEADKKTMQSLHSMLDEHCFKHFQFAANTERALEIIKNEKLLDMVILCPGVLPKMKAEFCKRLRAQDEFNNIRVLLETNKSEFEICKKIKHPGVDLICEPINRYNVLIALKHIAENRSLLRDMHRYREKMQGELDQARAMQDMILPKPEMFFEMEDKYRIKVSSYFETCEITGGDFWGMEPISRDTIGFYIIDCTGHGVLAAFNTFRIHAVMKDIDDLEIRLNPDLFLSYLNKKLCGLFSPGQFATMFYGIIDIKTDRLRYASAASTPPLLIRDNCSQIEKLACEGYLLGIMKNAFYETHEISFKTGDKILLYSDAVIENINQQGEMYGEERLIKSAGKAPECRDGVNLLAKIISEFNAYRDGPLADDLTVNIYTRI